MSLVNERHKKIIDLVDSRSQLSTKELMEILDISRETARRDINTLYKNGLLIKTHGGVISKTSADKLYDLPILMREVTHAKKKQEICSYASTFISSTDSIFIDNSSTGIQLINHIPKLYDITLITNSIKLLIDLAKIGSANWNVISLGGNFNLSHLSTSNYLAMRSLELFKPNKAFVSCNGIDDELIVNDNSLNDVEIKRAVLKSCKESFLLVDSTKLGERKIMTIAKATEFDHIITNVDAPANFVERLKSAECNVHLAGK